MTMRCSSTTSPASSSRSTRPPATATAVRPAGDFLERHAVAERRLHAGDDDQAALLASHADERLPAGHRGLGAARRRGEEARRRAVARRHDDRPASSRGRAIISGAPISPRRSSGSKRSTAAISKNQSALPRQGDGARRAVHRVSRTSSRRPNGASAASRSPERGSRSSRKTIARSRRTRTWLLEPGAQPRKVWDRKQDAAYDNPGTPVAHGAAAAGGGGGRGGSAAADPPERRLHLSRGRGRIGRRRPAVRRSAERQDARDATACSGPAPTRSRPSSRRSATT